MAEEDLHHKLNNRVLKKWRHLALPEIRSRCSLTDACIIRASVLIDIDSQCDAIRRIVYVVLGFIRDELEESLIQLGQM